MPCIEVNTQNNNAVPSWVDAQIVRILRNGNTAEIKKENGKYVVIEIKRKAYRG